MLDVNEGQNDGKQTLGRGLDRFGIDIHREVRADLSFQPASPAHTQDCDVPGQPERGNKTQEEHPRRIDPAAGPVAACRAVLIGIAVRGSAFGACHR
jgi:hypothetical protein